jgi:hypothetical protein
VSFEAAMYRLKDLDSTKNDTDELHAVVDFLDAYQQTESNSGLTPLFFFNYNVVVTNMYYKWWCCDEAKMK